MSNRNNNAYRPIALRNVAAAQIAMLRPLQDRQIAVDIGSETWHLHFSAQMGLPAGPSVCAHGAWLGHRIALRFPQALLQRTLQISAPGLPAMDIPQALLAAVGANAIGAWLAELPYRDSLRIDTVEDDLPTTVPANTPITPNLAGTMRLHLLAQRFAPTPDAIAYTIAVDLDPALAAALPQFCAGLPLHLPKPTPTLLDIPLKLRCEIGQATVPYATLDALRHGDILFFTPYADQNNDDPSTLTIRLSYRTQALMHAHIHQPGLMVITNIDMNDKKSFLYDDLIEESASDPFHAIDPMHALNEEETEYDTFADEPSLYPPPADFPHDRLNQLPLQVVFDVGNCEMSFAELQKLQPGSVIPLASSLPEVVKITVNGRVIASGELVEIDGKIGVMLARLADAR